MTVPRAGVTALARELRLIQWAKNLLVFVPLLTSHRILEREALTLGVRAFLAFSLVASAVYLANDLVDLDDDRRHPVKRLRPLASGELPVAAAFALIPLLVAAAAALAWQMPPAFGMYLAAYVGANLFYSLAAKRVALLDVFVLAGPMGPPPNPFYVGVAMFLAGWFMVRTVARKG